MMKIKIAAIFFTLFLSRYCNATSNGDASYRYNIAICSIFQNEARFLKEWIEFHQLVGVDHFYLYNNLSQDEYQSVLAPYIENGTVELYDWPYKSHSKKTAAYQNCLKNAMTTVKWMAFIDTDEYLLPVQENTLSSVLEEFSDYGGLIVYSIPFGTSGVSKIPQDILMIEALLLKGTYPESQSNQFKSIVRPRRVKQIETLSSIIYTPPYYAVNEEKEKYSSKQSTLSQPIKTIRINHYWTRDEDFFLNHKMKQRTRTKQTPQELLSWAMSSNAKFDTAILRFCMPLRDCIFPEP